VPEHRRRETTSKTKPHRNNHSLPLRHVNPSVVQEVQPNDELLKEKPVTTTTREFTERIFTHIPSQEQNTTTPTFTQINPSSRESKTDHPP
jgi:hypothetical protein